MATPPSSSVGSLPLRWPEVQEGGEKEKGGGGRGGRERGRGRRRSVRRRYYCETTLIDNFIPRFLYGAWELVHFV